MENCKECIYSRLVVSENGYHAICTLSDDDVYDCLSNNLSKFVEANHIYLMCGGNRE